MKHFGIVLLGLCFLVVGCQSQKTMIHKISGEILYQEKEEQKNMLLLDVRTKEEFAQGHIPDALNIPVETMNEKTMQKYNKNTKVIVYCRSGSRSSTAAHKLKKLGFKRIYDLGGISQWSHELVTHTNNS